ncbi:endonuclease/exonuclease/phosphatase family protein [Gracilibacillus oryzae]|uniref:Endonuclease/exonuclease/phosphatase family protein n=1 Tax=Gracilibacillus oryzae TaxID=1672701 RepID=A0A7C8GV47_9BACI|nr:endonuclease/exonuclease/phosphatase family protein [Gracilibacillus oryzae]KAB8138091.1 endonuclease/exonuclease/phosphatase family protein [Gracilibacillus oryzae]
MKKVLQSVFVLTVVTVLVSSAFASASTVQASGKPDKAEEVDLQVMAFNLRYLNDSDPSPHTWAERVPAIKKLIRQHKPDIIGTQEVVYQQLQDLETNLKNYSWIGLGREGGSNGEYSAIFYNDKQYSPLEYDHFWLSDTPAVIGSATWGNTIPRMVTWAKFLDKKSQQSFYVINTHFDHRSENAREKSAELIVEKIQDFDPELPILLTGDFNASPESAPHTALTSENAFDDLWNTADVRINENLGTFNGFDDPTGGGPEKRIDWVLAKGNIETHSIEIINDEKKGQFPSDHYPVMADVTLSY